ncbi:PsbP-related protein [Foetidibacter luteolus]|uniref:PsbP-related protein n=1 Tax=Foetidibacter luteolus TaxID=2608880 RepID=UPI00129BA413|nr:PsbP-related protein [Foetidibacter luteolus]
MRHLLLVLFTVFIIQASGQSFVTFKDTINHFSINIPTGWKYGVNKNYPAIKLLAYRTPLSKADTSRDNFNINIIETPNKNLDKTFEDFLKYLPDAKNFKLIDRGDTTFNGKKFKRLIETHKNEGSDIQMHNYDFVTFKDGKTYILTMVTFSYAFDTVKPLFDKIASSFILLD